MKKTFNFILSILKSSIGTLLEILGVTILLFGSLFYGLGVWVKNPSFIGTLIREMVKNLKSIKK